MEELLALIRTERVGGAFWGAQPVTPAGRDVLLAPAGRRQTAEMLAEADRQGVAGRVLLLGGWPEGRDGGELLSGEIDPWWLLDRVQHVWADADGELAFLAALAGKDLRTFGSGKYEELSSSSRRGASFGQVANEVLVEGVAHVDPFSGKLASAATVVSILGEWRRLIDANRPIRAIGGIARWKQSTVRALLWGGASKGGAAASLRGGRSMRLAPGDEVAIWRSRLRPGEADALARQGAAIREIEDGFIRSTGLGANCVPPLSIVVDGRGVHFDPNRPSDLEVLLQEGEFPPDVTSRAAALCERIVESGVSKYGKGANRFARPGGARRHVLVTGQVEDDRSVLSGGGGLSNLDLLVRARAQEPDAFLIYKPHPDVEAGHRKGRIPDPIALCHADMVVRDHAISSILNEMDSVHVLTSLAGFEALIRNKEVTTHGVPFYAGWGLTNDLGAVPHRRTARRSIYELVAAVLILYPRYLDPVTRLPCPVEVLVERMISGDARMSSPLNMLRAWQGRINAALPGWRRSV